MRAQGYGSEFRRGFIAILPLWAGVIPFGIAFAVLARTASFTILETQALSLLVFAGSSQVAIVTLSTGGAGIVISVLTAILLNLRHILYSLSLSKILPRHTQPPRTILAFVLTDEVYGMTIKAFLDGRGSDAFLLGAGISLYTAFNGATLAGSLLGALLPNPQKIGLDFIFPLTFLALLLPLLRSRRQLIVTVVSGLLALFLSRVAPQGVAILVSAVIAAMIGATLEQGASNG